MNAGHNTIDMAFDGRLGAFSLDLAVHAPMRGITAFFGPSGCGKTTILRCVAGLHRLRGRLQVGGETWQDDAAGVFRKPHQRSIGYVFQEASLFPHLCVRKNLLFGARRNNKADTARGLDFDTVVDLLGIAALLGRAPAALSGGERQRVAIGRALLSHPRLLLMDEPLSGLDRLTKEEILPYLEALHENLSIPILYVSHDLAEVQRLADTLVLLEQGRVLAHGPLPTLEADPSLPLLRAPEAAVTLHARVAGIDEVYALTTLAVDGGELVVPGLQGAPGNARRVRIRASDVSFTRARPVETTILNCLPARVVSVYNHADEEALVNVVVGLGENGGGARIAGRVTRKSRQALGLIPGLSVFAQIKSLALDGATQGRAAQSAPEPAGAPNAFTKARASSSPARSARASMAR